MGIFIFIKEKDFIIRFFIYVEDLLSVIVFWEEFVWLKEVRKELLYKNWVKYGMVVLEFRDEILVFLWIEGIVLS